jgi:hypothetical protein
MSCQIRKSISARIFAKIHMQSNITIEENYVWFTTRRIGSGSGTNKKNTGSVRIFKALMSRRLQIIPVLALSGAGELSCTNSRRNQTEHWGEHKWDSQVSPVCLVREDGEKDEGVDLLFYSQAADTVPDILQSGPGSWIYI